MLCNNTCTIWCVPYFIKIATDSSFFFYQQNTILQNSLTLNNILIKSYTRRQALESRHQYVRSVRNECIRVADTIRKSVNPFTSSSLPSRHQLIRWSHELAKRGRIQAGLHYVETELGIIGYNEVNHYLSLHTVKEVKASVEQEIAWFNEPKLAPRTVFAHPSNVSINCFKSLIWGNPNLTRLPAYDVYPGVLAQLCFKRYIHSDHVDIIKSMLNKEQSSVKCIYYNHTNAERMSNSKTSNGSTPEYLCFIVNVGLGANNKTYCGTDHLQGNHWTLAIYEKANNKLTYGDSLGWDIPEDLVSGIKVVLNRIYQMSISKINIELCHEPKNHRNGRSKCAEGCSKMYPFQTCGNICGAVALVVAAIACLRMQFFRHICSKDLDTLNFYISQPTKYGKYLRSVLMCWIAEKKVNINFVIPGDPTEIEESDSDTDEDIPRVNNTDPVQPNEDKKEKQIDKIKTVNKECEPMPMSSAVNKKAREMNNDKTVSSFKCPVCPQTCAKKTNLICHINRKHKDKMDITNQMQRGKCLCLECNRNFRRIVDLRQHLSLEHSFIFRTECLHFSNREGRYLQDT